MKAITELLKGVLEGCILEIISRGETYGYEITARLKVIGFEDIVEGTVYAILVRLERGSLVSCIKKVSDIGPPRKFYALTDAGYKELHTFWAKWDFVSSKLTELRGNK